MTLRKKVVLAFLFGFLVLAGIEGAFRFGDYVSFSYIQHQHEVLSEIAERSFWFSALVYLVLFWLVSATFLPLSTLMTISAGVIFGFWAGLSLVCIAVVAGSSSGFMLARYLFRSLIQKRYHGRLLPINQELLKHGGSYVFLLRMLPGIPFALTNLLMGVSSVNFYPFVIFTLLGLLPRIILYVNAGTQIANISSPHEILGPRILISLALMGIVPVVSRWAIQRLRSSK